MNIAPGWPIPRSLITLSLLAVAQPLMLAEDGLRYVGDLNGDGIPDRLESGPLSHFGNGGGPFILTVSSPDGPRRFDVGGYGIFAAEVVDEQTFRLWSYGRISADSGYLMTYSITKGTMTEDRLLINPGDGGTDLGNALFDVLFAGKYRIVAERVENHTPPPGPARGGEWGK